MATKKRQKRRSYGQLNERKKGTWQIRVPLEVTDQKNRRYHTETYHGTREQAEARLRELFHLKSQGQALTGTNISFRTYFEKWMTRKEQKGIKERSLRAYRGWCELYILPRLGDLPLAKVSAETITDLYSDLFDRGLSSSTRKTVHVMLADIFRSAAKLDYIRKNPMLQVDPPKLKQAETKALTIEQMTQFLKTMEGAREYAMWLLAMTTGARPSEYLALEWSDIDDQARTVTIRRGVTWRRSGDWYLDTPKSAKAVRTLPLPQAVMTALADHRRRQAEERLRAGGGWHKAHNFIFTNELGEPLSLDRVRRTWKKGLEAAGLPEFKLYATRHSSATGLLGQGVNLKTISERLGHSSVAITLARYAHVSFDQQIDASEKLEKALFG